MNDPRYETIRGLLIEGHIKKFTEIFDWIPYTAVATQYGMNNNRMKKMIADPSLWTLGELWQLADWIGYNRKKLVDMAGDEGDALRQGKEYPGPVEPGC